ncbi:MAG: tetratricopeptide repeat protein, partial [Acidobacteriota bacterium]
DPRVSMPPGQPAPLAVRAMHAALVQGLVDRRGLIAVEVPADAPAATLDLARELAVDEVLDSSLTCDGRRCSASLRRVDRDGGVLWIRNFTAPPDRIVSLREAVLSHLNTAYPSAPLRPESPNFTVGAEDYERFLRLTERYRTRGQGFSSEQVLDELDELASSSPHFVAIPLLTAHVALQRHQSSRAPGDAERAQGAIERALTLAPSDPRVLLLAARAARQAANYGEAKKHLAAVERLEPGHSGAEFQMALLHERRGDVEGAKAIVKRVVQRHPSTYHLLNGADLLYRQGDFDGARALLEQGLARSPDRFNGLSRLAQLELAHGDLERSADLYRRLVDRAPEETELLNLGTALMMLGRLDEAKACFERVVEANPSSPYATLSLADVTKLAGDGGAARQLYSRVLELTEDPEGAAQLDSVRAQALAHLGRGDDAVERVQAAVQRRPDHPWVAYEAALVHALIDDRASALWNARRALDGGIGRRWFALAWFDPVRAELSEELRRREAAGET